MKIKKAIVLLLSSLTVVGLLSGCASHAAKEPGYRYGTVVAPAKDGSICNAPNYIADKEGFFKKNGLKPDLRASPKDISVLEAGFASGKYDVNNGDFQYLPAIQNGAPIKAVAGLHQGCVKVLVPKNSKIHSVKQLKNKNIGVPAPGSTPMFVTSMALEHSGVSPKNGVKWRSYPNNLLGKAAQKGQVQAIGVVDPFASQYQHEDGFRVLVNNNNRYGNNHMAKMGMRKHGSCCYLYLSSRLIRKDPAKARAIVRSYHEAANWINRHPKKTAEIELKDHFVSRTKYTNMKHLTNILSSEKFHFSANHGKADFKNYIVQLKRAGYLKKDTNVNQLLKYAYWNSESK
ncbi:ABC transporter substrate-binding protein [Acetilactobacillus jinshanensis]|uniref:ABC transporter substrate-binding protein n=1 Tax=Acetilactobacillus jinshanensis TaxID=1720083 RepID=A0A4P6ZLC7_9LACO|nr:ABC transporter substrate-binding protein [Acetilactobacillus jinshanensis]QBP18373.1 ABC transporter substrate-binding protein [Acetilactobacillus jinshanensis]URL61238.1 ABC transporter substrate-binding protein [uncultured bacterium]